MCSALPGEKSWGWQDCRGLGSTVNTGHSILFLEKFSKLQLASCQRPVLSF